MMQPRVPGEQSADCIRERAKVEAHFAEALLKILLAAQDDSPLDRNDIPRPGELNRYYTRLYDQIWAAAFHVLTVKKTRKKAEVVQ